MTTPDTFILGGNVATDDDWLRRRTWMGFSFGHLDWSNHKGGGGHAHAAGDVIADRWTVVLGGLAALLLPAAIVVQVVGVVVGNVALIALSGIWLVMGGLGLVSFLYAFRGLQE